MTEGSIFLLRGGELAEMPETGYATEELLQRYLEEHPRLLGGDQMVPEAPRRWVVVSREIAMAGEERGVGYVDHAFLDQDGIPTLIEVKRSSDSRIRREVVGQLLDYAANAVAYWPVEAVRAAYEANCQARGVEPLDALEDLIGADGDVEAFWETVGSNLQRGRIRLVFVADRIPAELRRIVEFLNEQMSPAEVLAVEVKQYLDPDTGLTSLVPRIVGKTTAAERKKATRPRSGTWDEARLFARITDRFGADAATAARAIYQWGIDAVPDMRWGTGAADGSFILDQPTPQGSCPFLAVYSSAHVEMRFWALKQQPAFAADDARRSVAERLSKIPGVQLSASAHDGRPSMPLSAFINPDARGMLIDVLRDIVARLHELPPPPNTTAP